MLHRNRGGQRSELQRRRDAPPSSSSQPRATPYTFYGPRGIAVVRAAMAPTCGVASAAARQDADLKRCMTLRLLSHLPMPNCQDLNGSSRCLSCTCGFSRSYNTGGSCGRQPHWGLRPQQTRDRCLALPLLLNLRQQPFLARLVDSCAPATAVESHSLPHMSFFKKILVCAALASFASTVHRAHLSQ